MYFYKKTILNSLLSIPSLMVFIFISCIFLGLLLTSQGYAANELSSYYNIIMGINQFILIYIPFYLIMIRNFSVFSTNKSILIKYKEITKWWKKNIYSLLFFSMFLSLFLNLLFLIVLISKKIDMISFLYLIKHLVVNSLLSQFMIFFILGQLYYLFLFLTNKSIISIFVPISLMFVGHIFDFLFNVNYFSLSNYMSLKLEVIDGGLEIHPNSMYVLLNFVIISVLLYFLIINILKTKDFY
ncbi:hypothetical protein [Paenibacillus bovis]|uniref:Uncharacterized protein n=1 Tax=Paenibacillus bovis TaxID=1616788 RepID=A0A172ZBI1_9BACL|nr:hypothetical protein [Paenibacillus bovis]ANF95001.1 hypothetical protein AR543_02440 [Paenibacillus bovis]